MQPPPTPRERQAAIERLRSGERETLKDILRGPALYAAPPEDTDTKLTRLLWTGAQLAVLILAYVLGGHLVPAGLHTWLFGVALGVCVFIGCICVEGELTFNERLLCVAATQAVFWPLAAALAWLLYDPQMPAQHVAGGAWRFYLIAIGAPVALLLWLIWRGVLFAFERAGWIM
jgi:hypothetical protein